MSPATEDPVPSRQLPSQESPSSPPPHSSPDPAPSGDEERRSGLGAVLQEEEFSVAAAIGGPRGIIESALPTLLFVVLFVSTRSVMIAAVAATAAVAVLLIARIVQRQSISTVLGGLIAAALGAVLAIRSGEGSDFYWPGIVTNAVALLVLLTSLALRRPLVGLMVGLLDPRVKDWVEDPDARRVYTRATLLFVLLYAAKLAVQLPLLLTGQVAALGAAKIAMGLPAFVIVAYLVWLMHRGLLARRDRG
ncbi:hypothetical protein CFK38_12290 [Brachybacterium vulturis]|uniref:Potassium ABC transporter n=1 Tax=Brachybacterium vulturis TaxID=2017484 RepID=A0A291GQE7_9MICO|nr:DUF3159 domain-containing protein [Brachybacterium vulturis]ATG52216.1 hypothetical protein CFK38_12290 [Brachybacterium vulturis]